ncbi:glycosyltransferase family 2 protein [Acinetobacter johnsonii]|uniref:glycosyltransferase family 2 protein n=1 Tax=Acinetobacter johnsonii TaxID=40214 RepID=UPI00102881BA|nr:glycosyltransferase family 2 protein [Acinetobacter johnsonii]RZN84959.1 glycosyltransferase family 2 protein [Acinetobacter johnsonii]
MNYLISIIIPMYNVEQYIEKCANSILSQNNENIEYIFIDDCSPDRSSKIVNNVALKYNLSEPQCRIIKHDINKGIAGTRNTGIDLANGKYIFQIDGDDYIEPNAIKNIITAINETDADIIVFDYYLEWKKTFKRVEHKFSNNKIDYLKMLIEGETETAVWNKVIKRALFNENNIRFVEGVNYGEDYMVIPKLVYKANKIFKLKENLYHYIRWNVNSYTSNLSERNIGNLHSVLENHKKYFLNEEYLINIESNLDFGYICKLLDLIKECNNEEKLLEIKKYFNDDFNIILLKEKISFYKVVILFFYKKNLNSFLIYLVRFNKYILFLLQYLKGRK